MSSSRVRSRGKQLQRLGKFDVQLFEKVSEQLRQLRDDFGSLAKSKPDTPLNTLKVGFVNEKLAEANRLLSGAHKPFEKFEQFHTDDLPSNSDVLVVLSQYLACLEGWRSANVVKRGHSWVWNVDEEKFDARPPSRAASGGDE
jgi:hypothetical protein